MGTSATSMKIEVPEEYRYVADRANFIHYRRAWNLAFMLSLHANDKTDEWIKSDEFKRMQSELEEAADEKFNLLYGTVANIMDMIGVDMNFVHHYCFSKENREVEVFINEKAS